MAKQRVVGTGPVEDRIDHVFTYKGMEDVSREQVNELLNAIFMFTVNDRPRARSIQMAEVLGVKSLSHTRIPLHLSQARLIHYNNRYGWSLTPDAAAYIEALRAD
jgi:Mn-dependent DtxR family transcriptional regulator